MSLLVQHTSTSAVLFSFPRSAWVQPKDLSRLSLKEIEAYVNEPSKKNGDLLKGYKIAMDPNQWEREQEAARERAEEETANEPVDELDEDAEEDDAGAEDEDEKPAKSKKRKRETKEKSKKEKAGDGAKAKAAKKKLGARKSNAMVESEDEGGDAGPSSKSAAPASKKAKNSKDTKEGTTDGMRIF